MERAPGQSGFAWSWFGAAMQASTLPFGVISVPGYRYHPAVLAQAAATCGEMFPGRLWLALGSGQAINEAITGAAWPEKAERNARLAECAQVIRALFSGETITHRGRVIVVEAKLYSRPSSPVPLIGAAVTQLAQPWLVSGRMDFSPLQAVISRRLAKSSRRSKRLLGDDKPIYLQHALSWAETEDEAFHQALDQWAPVSAGGEVNWNLRRPSDFDRIARTVGRDDIGECVKVPRTSIATLPGSRNYSKLVQTTSTFTVLAGTRGLSLKRSGRWPQGIRRFNGLKF